MMPFTFSFAAGSLLSAIALKVVAVSCTSTSLLASFHGLTLLFWSVYVHRPTHHTSETRFTLNSRSSLFGSSLVSTFPNPRVSCPTATNLSSKVS